MVPRNSRTLEIVVPFCSARTEDRCCHRIRPCAPANRIGAVRACTLASSTKRRSSASWPVRASAAARRVAALAASASACARRAATREKGGSRTPTHSHVVIGATSQKILRFSGRDEENPSEDIFWKARLGASASHAHLTSARARHRHAIHMSAFAVSASSVRAVSTAIGYVRDRLRPIHHSPIVSNTIGITRPKYPVRCGWSRASSLARSVRLPPRLL